METAMRITAMLCQLALAASLTAQQPLRDPQDRPLQPVVHRHLLYRRQGNGDRQDDLGDYRGNLRAALLCQRATAPLDGPHYRTHLVAAVGHCARPGLSRRSAVLQRATG